MIGTKARCADKNSIAILNSTSTFYLILLSRALRVYSGGSRKAGLFPFNSSPAAFSYSKKEPHRSFF